jgi:hypothetical protein
VKKPDQPVHSHPLDQTDEACTLCASHGNALEQAEPVFEVAKPVVHHTGPVKVPTVADRLAALLEEADDEEPASESDEDLMMEEDYEEEDD